jgi:hypothetical protein
MISEPMVHSTQTMHISCVKISTISKWTKISLEPHHLGVSLAASRKISKPMVRLAHTVHQSSTGMNTVSKQKEVRFHMTHVI